MTTKKHYPDMALIRRKGKLVCQAVQTLVEQGIEVEVVNFKTATPVIDVADCPSTQLLHGVAIGQVRHSDDEVHIKKSAHVCGCQVVWSEAK
ncbi:MAG: hypothetical protein Q8L79_03160 [Methylobacter sp.]|uniref:hypothetical protein n=1 Tax=Methylobacter sp. TaxID=2051955 RepID=UPI00272F0C8E|nr:hypothetical protein [Methylobacter sp.]MDP1664100.1 hypothetical protein [Methylobacter sp.]